MSGLFVFPADTERARERLSRTLERAVALEQALAALPPSQHDVARGAEREAGGLYVWGVKPGARNRRSWERMQSGDTLLCVQGDHYHRAMRILGTLHGETLAERLWGRDRGGAVEEQLVFVSRPAALGAPLADATEWLPRRYVGLTAISEARIARIRREFGSVGGFVAGRLAPAPVPSSASHSLSRTILEVSRRRRMPAPATRLVREHLDGATQGEAEPPEEGEPWAGDADAGREAAAAQAGPPARPWNASLLGLGLAALACAAGLLWLGAGALRGDALGVEPLSVPPELSARGYTDAVLARRLADELRAARAWPERPESFVETARLPRVALVARDAAQGGPRVSGEVTREGARIALRLRLGGDAERVATLRGEAGGPLLRRGAAEIAAAFDPLLAAALRVDEDPEAALRFLAQPGPDREPRAAAIRARALHRLGERTRALEHYAAALAADERLVAAHRGLGDLLYAWGDLERARGSYERALGIDAGDAASLLGVGRVLAARHDAAAAAERFTEAARIAPGWAALHATWGDAWLDAGDARAAAERYAHAARLAPERAAHHVRWGEALRRSGRPERAAARFATALSLQPDTPAWWVSRGAALAASGEPARAIEAFRRALAIDPGNAEAQRGWGNALRAQGELRAAERRLAEASRLAPHSAGILADWALALAATGQRDAARERALRALELDPSHSRAHYAHGNLLAGAGRLEAALDAYRRAVALDATDADALNNWGNLLSAQGRHDEAIDRFRRALSERPDFASAYNNWGLALRALGDLDGATEKLRRATELDPDDADAWYNWANALAAQQDFEGAIRKYARAAALAPDHAPTYLNWGNVLRATIDYVAATEKYRRAIELDPQAAGAYNNWGLALQEQGEFTEAARKFQEASRAAPEEPAIFYNWGLALEAQRERRDAIAKYRRALALEPQRFAFLREKIEALQQGG